MISRDDFEKKQLVFLFSSQGEKLSFSNDNLVVRDKDGRIKHQSTCYRIFALFVVGNITITSGLIYRAKKFCFTIVLMTGNMRVYDILGFSAEGNSLLRARQYSCSECERLAIAKHITRNKIRNQAAALMRQRHRGDAANEVIASLKAMAGRLDDAASVQELMGYEGSAAKQYFGIQFNNVDWKGRKPRTKIDPVNTTLDIGYTLLFNFIESLLHLYGFDLYVAVLHQQFYMRKSLVCDLVEPFRPLVDCAVRKAINLGRCKVDDFICLNHGWALRREENKRYTLFLVEPLMERRLECFEYVRQYYRAFSRGLSIEEYPVFKL